jgi:dTDP-4-dehydrorhamnose 3,5-epimerase
MITITAASIAGVRLIKPGAKTDRRGRFVKVVQRDVFARHGIPTDFAEQYFSVSGRNVLRGLHFQTPPHHHDKLVTCVDGLVFDVVVDLRKSSPSYRAHESFELDGRNGDSVFVPAGCAHGFYVRSSSATVLYNVTSLYAESHDHGIRWDSVGAAWPSADPLVSERDAAFPTLAQFDTPFR